MHLEVNNGWLVNVGFTHAESASNMLAYTIFKLRILEISRLIFQISPCKPNIEKKFCRIFWVTKVEKLILYFKDFTLRILPNYWESDRPSRNKFNLP